MQDKELTYENLAPLYILNKNLELTPDPFRLQGDKITFIVPFREYRKFIQKCLRDVDYLYTPTRKLLEYDKTDNKSALYSSYLKDMAIAVCKELHYAEVAKKDATHYRHMSNGIVSLNQDYMHEVTLESNLQNQLRTYMSSHDFPLPRYFRTNNNSLWEYANTLYYLAYNGGGEWEVACDG